MDQSDDIDVDGLFNEENLNNAALGGGILSENAILQGNGNQYICSPAQTERLVALSANGSFNTLAWARPGLIARIVENGTRVEITGQRIDPKTSQWTLMDPHPLNASFDDVIGLLWTMAGTELAVIERKGRVHIFNMLNTALNTFGHSVHSLHEESRDTHQPIGIWWLTLSRGDRDKKKTVLENAKEGQRWKHEHIEGGFYPPHAVRALCVVDRTGTLSVLFTRDGGSYKTAHLPLSFGRRITIFTHAALAQTPEGRLLVALHATSGHISIYSVNIVFTPEEVLPALSVEAIDMEIAGIPPYQKISNQPMDHYLLLHFHILSESEYSWHHLEKPHITPKQPATLLAVYASHNEQKDAVGNQYFGNSIIKRWQIQKARFELHSHFKQATMPTEQLASTVEPLEDVFLPAVVSNMQVIDPGNAIVITTLDGTTTFYNPNTASPIAPDPNWQVVSSIGQVPLDFPALLMSPTQCASPHALMLAYTDVENKLNLSHPRQREQSLSSTQPRELDPSNPADEAMIAGYILAFSRSCWQAATFDDVLASIHHSVPATSLIHVRRQLFLSLFQPKNLLPGPSNMSELEKVPHSQITFKALALHFGLFRSREFLSGTEKMAYIWAWTVLNLRWSIVVIGDTYKHLHQPGAQQNQPNAQQRPPQPPPLPTTFLDLVCHNIRWVFELYHLIFQSVIEVGIRTTHADLLDPPTFLNLLGDEQGDGRQGLVALLLNCNWSRSFLLIMGRLMKAVAAKAGIKINFRNSQENATTIHGSGTLGRIAKTIQSCCLHHGLTPEALELFFDPKFYPDSWQMGDDAANWATMETQIEMMITGQVSQTYQSTVKNLLENCIHGDDKMRQRGQIDRHRLGANIPERSAVFLNIDDIAFRCHSVAGPAEKARTWLGQGTFMEAMNFDGENRNLGNTNAKRNGNEELPPRYLYDVHKKLPLFSYQSVAINKGAHDMSVSKGVISKEEMLRTQVKRCVRCGRHNEDVNGMGKEFPRHVAGLMMRCVCDGPWIVEPWAEAA